MINLNETTLIHSLIGGVVIGIAVSILILLNGRVAGISGILGGVVKPKDGNFYWRIAFILGLVISPSVYSLFHILPKVSSTANHLEILVAGLLVGLGTRFGSGCTSGHGVCGVARLSTRSIVATICFMLAGTFTVFMTHHLI